MTKRLLKLLAVSLNTAAVMMTIYSSAFPHKAPLIIFAAGMWNMLVYYCTFIRPYK